MTKDAPEKNRTTFIGANQTIAMIVSALLGAALVYLLLPRNQLLETNEKVAGLEKAESEKIALPTLKRDPEIDQLVELILSDFGIPTAVIRRGVYNIRESGRQSQSPHPLIEFQRPSQMSAVEFWGRLETKLAEQGFEIHPARDEQRPSKHRAEFRALSKKGELRLVLRALPPGPHVTVIVSGSGDEPGLVESMLKLDQDVTYSVDAQGAYTKMIVESLAAEQREVLARVTLATPTAKGAKSKEKKDVLLGLFEQLHKVRSANGMELVLEDFATWKPELLGMVFSEIGKLGHFLLNRSLLTDQQATAIAYEFGVRIGTVSHDDRATEFEFKTLLEKLNSVLVFDGKLTLVVEASPVKLEILGNWLAGLRARGVSILRLSEVVL